MIELVEGTSVPEALAKLREIKASSTTIFTKSGVEAFNEYLRWISNSLPGLTGRLTQKEVETLLRTPSYWQIQALSPGVRGDTLTGTVHTEAKERQDALEEAQREIEDDYKKYGAGIVAIPDTNVLIDIRNYRDADWSALVGAYRRIDIVILSRVLDELNGLKDSNSGAAGKSAKQLLGSLTADFPTVGIAEIMIKSEITSPHVLHLDIDELTHQPLPIGDNEIIARSLRIKPYASHMVLLTNDVPMQLRARSYGLEARATRDVVPKT